jgi:membrane protease YdiL (CAAX protease family)
LPIKPFFYNLILKETSIKDLYEPVLLFFVIFFAPSAASFPFADISRTLLFRIPAFLLILRLAGRPLPLIPRRRDLYCGLFAFCALTAAGLCLALLAQWSGLVPAPPLPPPESAPAWIAAVLVSFSSGYLEEGYFRFYLLTRLEKAGIRARETAAVSTLLFALCHVYEGPWGTINAAIAGLVLALLFLRYRALHGIALAHGAYNVFVFAAAALTG